MAISYSMLDLATICEGDNIQQTFLKSLGTAQKAEELGFTRYWFSEHHNMPSVASAATSVLIGYTAQGTKTIRVGSGGIMLPNHAPLMVAEAFGTLGELYPGRIDLGLGRAPGTDNPATLAIRGMSVRLPYDFEMHIKELQQYFSMENKDGLVRAIPGEGVDIPLWILGSSPDSAHLAAKLGLPYAFAGHFAPAHLMSALRIYNDEFVPSKALAAPYSIACVGMIAGETDEEAWDLSTSMFRGFLGIITNKRQPLQPPIPYANMDNVWTPEQKAYVQQMTSFAFIGSKETLQKNLSWFVKETGVNEVMVLSQMFDLEKKKRSMEIFADVMTGI